MRHSSTDTRRTRLRVAAATVAALAGVMVFYYPTTALVAIDSVTGENIDDLINPSGPAHAAPDEDGNTPFNILLMGSDVRTGANEDIGGFEPGMRNDTTMLLHFNADRTEAVVISFPRDSMVDIPECKLSDGTRTQPQLGMFNLAFALGGENYDAGDAAACTINTVHANTGIPVDAWAVIDFEGVIKMVDSLGGVEMNIPVRIAAPKADLFLEPGIQVLSGKNALGFARFRTGLGAVTGSDPERIGRQQELMSAIFDTALQKNLLTDVGELTGFIRAGAGSLTVDEELKDVTLLAGLAADLNRIGADNIVYVTVPWEVYPADPNRLQWTADADRLFTAVAGDESVIALGLPEQFLGGKQD